MHVIILVWGQQQISRIILIILNTWFIPHRTQNSKHLQIPKLIFLQLSTLTNFIAHTDHESTKSSKPTLQWLLVVIILFLAGRLSSTPYHTCCDRSGPMAYFWKTCSTDVFEKKGQKNCPRIVTRRKKRRN